VITRKTAALLLLCAALPILADTKFHIRETARNDVPPGKGQCDIRLQVDDQVEVSVHGDAVSIRTIAGRNARDDGSECNAALPRAEVAGFRFEVKESRNEMRLLTPPNRANDFTAIVYIHDTDGGFGRYHFLLSWDKTAARDTGLAAGEQHGGFVRNNVTTYHGRGAGTAVYHDTDSRTLGDVNADVDLSGRIQVIFRINRGRPIEFDGMVVAREEGRIKADVTSEDGRLRGPMYLAVDAKQNVTNVTLDATDGRDRVQVTWDKR
jgi:hypothetical protein